MEHTHHIHQKPMHYATKQKNFSIFKSLNDALSIIFVTFFQRIEWMMLINLFLHKLSYWSEMNKKNCEKEFSQFNVIKLLMMMIELIYAQLLSLLSTKHLIIHEKLWLDLSIVLSSSIIIRHRSKSKTVI